MSDLRENNEEEMLVNQIHEEIRKIRRIKAVIDNNENRNGIYDPIDKTIIENESLKFALEDENLPGVSITKLEPIEDMLRCLKNEVELINKDISKIVHKTKEFEDFINRLNKNVENLALMIETGNNAQGSSKRLDLIEKNIKQRFLKEKRELKTTITTLFPDNPDIQDLIAQITEFYFAEGADKYMQMEDSDITPEQIEFLLRTEMFEVNPYNPKEIKLANLL